MKLDMAKFVAAPAGEVPPAVAASVETAAVTVDANAPNCDITALQVEEATRL